MAETVDMKPVFREAFKRRRCLVPIEAFYEWKKVSPKEKQPYAIELADRSIMALAGLWETWRSPAQETRDYPERAGQERLKRSCRTRAFLR